MSKFYKQKKIEYSSQEIFNLVMDIEKYPQFLPWCKNAKIIKILSPNLLHASLTVNFKGILQKYLSQVTWQENNNNYAINIEAIEGPFKKMTSHWKINNLASNQCLVDFAIEFEFSSILLQKLIGSLFGYASEKMINSFDERAKIIYKK